MDFVHTVITENDESEWDDETGTLYHFPKRYRKYLEPGTRLIYYKGRIKNKVFSDKRLTNEPHYFATAVIGCVYDDEQSKKGDLFAEIINYSAFLLPILSKHGSGYLEEIPESKKTNYWRNAVRPIDESVYTKILLNHIPTKVEKAELNDTDNTLESSTEGKASGRYVTIYERDPKYRKQALEIHGCTCKACGFNFGDFYGEYAEGYIHIHHTQPVSEFKVPKKIDPMVDLVPLCANCHSVAHRRKSKTLSVSELQKLIQGNSNKSVF